MPNPAAHELIEKVRRALGRAEPLKTPPTPPPIDESVTRLVPQNANLTDRFVKTATDAKLNVETSTPAELPRQLVDWLQLNQCNNIAIPVSDLFDRLGIPAALQAAGLRWRRWDDEQFTLDDAYELDCGITDIYAAIAETGSLVIRPSPGHGRALSLVPPIHVAIVEAARIVPDLIDLFAKISREERAPNITFITGPSKTADIEGSLVTGVHGPGLVQIFLLIEMV